MQTCLELHFPFINLHFFMARLKILSSYPIRVYIILFIYFCLFVILSFYFANGMVYFKSNRVVNDNLIFERIEK